MSRKTSVCLRTARCLCVLALSLVIMVGTACAKDVPKSSSDTSPPIFVPPSIGAPAERTGAGTRDVSPNASDALSLLVPAGGGLTTLESPPLVWRVRSGFRGVMRARLSELNGAGVELEQNGAFPPSLYGLDLQRSDLRLAEDKIYQWQVELIADGQVVASASSFVERVGAIGSDAGAAGIWFDVLADLVSMDLSGRVRVRNQDALTRLLEAGGLRE